MTKYFILLAAVLVGALIGWVLSRPQNPAADEVLVDEKKPMNLWPFVGGLIVLAVGLFFLAGQNRAPIDGEYNPAVIDGGTINPGYFNQDDQNQHDQKTSGAEGG